MLVHTLICQTSVEMQRLTNDELKYVYMLTNDELKYVYMMQIKFKKTGINHITQFTKQVVYLYEVICTQRALKRPE